MPRGRGRGRRGGGPTRWEVNRLRRQVQTLKMECRDSNTGRFTKRTSCIRLPAHEVFAMQYIIYDRPPEPAVSITLYGLPGHPISTKIPRLQRHKELDELSEYDDCA